MLTILAVHGYRSLRNVALPLGRLTVITGPNGSGKSSLYSAFNLLAQAASGSLISTLAHSGGLSSVLWAGPENITGAMKRGEVPIQGTSKRLRPVSLMLGLRTDDIGYLLDIGLPNRAPGLATMFSKDPVIKRELIWGGELPRPASLLVRRKSGTVLARDDRDWREVTNNLSDRDSMLSEIADPERTPEVLALRRLVRGWRFHDSFRTDAAAPARAPQVPTFTPVMAADGSDFVPAVQTILESAFAQPFLDAVATAFPGGDVSVVDKGAHAELAFRQDGLLRPLSAAELSDGTLRFLLIATALLSPRPPSLLVLNEPETSLHPEVLPGLADLIITAAKRTQVVVVSHSHSLIDALTPRYRKAFPDQPLPDWDEDDAVPGTGLVHHELTKRLGETIVDGQGLLSKPPWDWGTR